MENLIIKPTNKTPEINFNIESGIFLIKGRSIPENSIDYYSPIFNFADSYKKTHPNNTQINVQLEYFNTSSSKCLLEFFKKFEDISGTTVNWYYEEEDEDMLDAGNDYNDILNVEFKLIQHVI